MEASRQHVTNAAPTDGRRPSPSPPEGSPLGSSRATHCDARLLGAAIGSNLDGGRGGGGNAEIRRLCALHLQTSQGQAAHTLFSNVTRAAPNLARARPNAWVCAAAWTAPLDRSELLTVAGGRIKTMASKIGRLAFVDTSRF